MEKLVLTPGSKEIVTACINEDRLMQHEKAIGSEILDAVNAADQDKLDWFSRFGPSLRHIHMNVHAYRKQLAFGFTDEIIFGKYDWLARPEFLDTESIILGNPNHYAEHSIVHLGRGPAGVWTHAVNYSYGLASGGYALSVYGKQFPNRQDALLAGLAELKERLSQGIGSSDTTNYKQPIILATLKDLAKAQMDAVQLALF